MTCKKLLTAAVLTTTLVLGGQRVDAAITIQPDEATSKDTWAYQFFGSTDFGSANYSILSAGKTGSGHDFEAFIQFDLPIAALTADDVQSASINLYAISSESTHFGASPSSTYPLDVSAYANTSDWSESLTWNSRPSSLTTPADTFTMTGVGQWYALDVTDLVKSWLTDPSANRGVRIAADEILRTTPGNVPVIAVFESASGTNAPNLSITAVPEPAALSVLGIAAGSLLMRRRKA
jgi:hypothetical protein